MTTIFKLFHSFFNIQYSKFHCFVWTNLRVHLSSSGWAEQTELKIFQLSIKAWCMYIFFLWIFFNYAYSEDIWSIENFTNSQPMPKNRHQVQRTNIFLFIQINNLHGLIYDIKFSPSKHVTNILLYLGILDKLFNCYQRLNL